MRPICLSHKLTDHMLYQFNLPLPREGDSSVYMRVVARLVATPGVTWQDILKEVEEKGETGHLETVTIIYHFYLISMTSKGFLTMAQNFHHSDDPEADTNLEKRKENLAKELIAHRDYEANGGYDRKDHKQWDYWPKD